MSASSARTHINMGRIQFYVSETNDLLIPAEISIPNRHDLPKDGIIDMIGPDIEDMCVLISNSYKRDSIEDADLIIACVNDTKTLLGFLTAKYLHPDSKNILYISLICTNTKYSHVGTYIMNIIKEISFVNRIEKIILKSVIAAKGFYVKLGFNSEMSPRSYLKYHMSNDPGEYMSYNMTKYVKPSGGGRRRQIKRRSNRHTKKGTKTKRRR